MDTRIPAVGENVVYDIGPPYTIAEIVRFDDIQKRYEVRIARPAMYIVEWGEEVPDATQVVLLGWHPNHGWIGAESWTTL